MTDTQHASGQAARSPNRRPLLIAFYLPQFYPIPENDRQWGKGFTEWTNVAKAKPLFEGHYQPHIPADLGFYDLRLSETRIAQAQLAREHGIDAFCYYHYWFGNGRRALERPFIEVLKSGEPRLSFCLDWANESWTGVWHGSPRTTIIAQTYPGRKDYEAHFYALLDAFQDARYVKIEGRPLFLVHRPDVLPNPNEFTDTWNELAVKEGFPGMYLVGTWHVHWDHRSYGFNAKTYHSQARYVARYLHLTKQPPCDLTGPPERTRPHVFDYGTVMGANDFSRIETKDSIPTTVCNWDNTPRCSGRGFVYHDSSPALFARHLQSAYKFAAGNTAIPPIVFIRSWNEWAEGNHLEPDLKWDRGYLDAVRDVATNALGSAADKRG